MHATPARGHGRAGQQLKGGDGTAARAASAAAVAAEFPASLRIFVHFLEAADSHTVNAHLTRHAKSAIKF